jgi:hypothetical protein
MRDERRPGTTRFPRARRSTHVFKRGVTVDNVRQVLDVPVDAHQLLVETQTPLGFSVRVTVDRWKLIVTAKHPGHGRETFVKAALEAPDEIRQSRMDQQVLLFYKAEATERWTCAVVKRLASSGFLITAYPTGAIKEGVRVWPK